MEKELKVGDQVIFIDEQRARHNALVTVVWRDIHHQPEGKPPGCNLVFVSGDVTKEDPYGRQIERRTSLVHVSAQPARASCWSWPDES